MKVEVLPTQQDITQHDLGRMQHDLAEKTKQLRALRRESETVLVEVDRLQKAIDGVIAGMRADAANDSLWTKARSGEKS